MRTNYLLNVEHENLRYSTYWINTTKHFKNASYRATYILFITGIIGILIGIVGSEILLNILVKMMHLKVGVSIGFEFPALIQTIVMLVLAFILIMFQNFLFLKRRTILSMMKDSTKSEATKAKITVPELIAGILGIIMIIFGYYISTEMFGKFEVLTMVLVTPFLILFLTVVGLIYSLEVQYLSYLNH